jgi:TonB family protein
VRQPSLHFGNALLRLQVDGGGRVTDVEVLSETGNYGFGSACEKLVRRRQGWAPATTLKYRCDFEIEPGSHREEAPP